MAAIIRAATAADAAAIARAHVASWRTTYRGILPDKLLAELSVERRAEFWGRLLARADRAGLTLVAAHPAEGVVGFADAGPAREALPGYDAELFAIYLLERHQRGGLGRALLRGTAEGLLERGHGALFLWVLAENAARQFYEALGGQVIGAGEEELGGAYKQKLAYGWPDLAALAARAGGR